MDKLRELNRSPIEINFANKPTDSRFANKRAEMWWNMREWLSVGGSLPERDIDNRPVADDLRADLTGPEYFFTPSGKIMLESKEDMKKRGLKSPDMGDALALTFAMPAARRDPNMGAPRGESGGRVRDDDIFQWGRDNDSYGNDNGYDDIFQWGKKG